MKTITLYRNKGVAIVDDADYERLSRYKWHIDRGYAAMTVKIPHKGIMYMHRLVNRTPTGMITDHINGNKLDNRCSNLRTCDHSANNANCKDRKTNTSGFRGVVWHKSQQIWQAQISVEGRCLYLGQFKDKMEAALAYNKKAREIHGEFAKLNLEIGG